MYRLSLNNVLLSHIVSDKLYRRTVASSSYKRGRRPWSSPPGRRRSPRTMHGTELALNVPERRHGGESPDRAVGDQKLTVRRFLILAISVVASTAVWQRTGGDVALTGLAAATTPSALSRWIAE